MNSFVKIVEKISHVKYLNRGIILSLDVLFSLCGTILAYIFLSLWEKGTAISNSLSILLSVSFCVSLLVVLTSRIYRTIIRHSTLSDLPKIFFFVVVKTLMLYTMMLAFNIISINLITYFVILDIFCTSFLVIGYRAFTITIYYSLINNLHKRNRALIFSTQGQGPLLGVQLSRNINPSYRFEGFITTNKHKDGALISGKRVYYFDENNYKKLNAIIEKNNIDSIIFTSAKRFEDEKERLVEYCLDNNIKMFLYGGMQTLTDGKLEQPTIHPVQIEDLLERDEITIEIDKISAQLSDKVILVTGAAGSIGREIVLQLAKFDVRQIVLLDNAETPLHNIQLELEKLHPRVTAHFCLGDVRSKERMRYVFERFQPQIVFHAAAYKHVPMVESNPCEGVLVNVFGTLNVANQAIDHNVEKFVMVSTDKAVNPTNVMGATKRIAEMCVQKLNGTCTTKFITTRFGNVLGSNGSVIPLFKEQIAAGGPLTVTHPEIVRYFMTIPEACRLVLQAGAMGKGGEIFVFDMGEQVRIADLARKMIRLSGLEPERDIKIVYTGLRPGEKLYEELLSDKETTSATSHYKIRITPSVTNDDKDFDKLIQQMIEAAENIQINETVKTLKTLAPEFKSNNSAFAAFDK